MGNIVQGIAKDLKNIPKTIKSKTKSLEPKKVILKVLPYAIFGYVADKFYYGYRITEGSDTLNRLMDSLASNAAFQNPMPSFYPMDLLIGVAFGVGMRLIVYFKAKNAKKFRHDVCLDVKRATKTILVLADIEELMKECMGDPLKYDATVLAVKSLIEMITAKGVNTYYGAKVTYANVIDQLNIILEKDSSALNSFLSTCADKFVENIKVKKISNYSGYMKSILWGNITSFSLEWNGFFHRSQATILNQ